MMQGAAEDQIPLAGHIPGRQVFGFPASVFFILGNEFCERYSFYGMRAVLIPYLTKVVGFNDNDSSALFHAFNMLCYFTPLIGAIIADSYWGKFKTILVISLIYATGNLVMALTSIPALGAGHGSWYGPIVGLIIIGIGTGGIKPCVAAFGGDQFDATQKQKSVQFFSLFYGIINAGSLISIFVSPILKGNVDCFDQDTCYPLAFGVPAVLMTASVVFFVVGGVGFGYVKNPPEGNVFKDTVKCIFTALRERWRRRSWIIQQDHWLDWASPQFPEETISNVKAVVGVVAIFSPLPFFWALYDQQGSKLVLQSYKMDARIGRTFFQPEMFQVVNPILILLFIPLFDYAIYPLVEKCGIRTLPLRRIGCGLFLAGVAFVISGILELNLENQLLRPPTFDSGYLSIANQNDRNLSVKIGNRSVEIGKNGLIAGSRLSINRDAFNSTLRLEWCFHPLPPVNASAFRATKNLGECPESVFNVTDIPVVGFDWEADILVVVFFDDKTTPFHYEEKISQPQRNKIRISVISPSKSLRHKILIVDDDKLGAEPLKINSSLERNVFTIDPDRYSLKIEDDVDDELELVNGGVYALTVVEGEGGRATPSLVETTDHFRVNIFWQLPQTVIFVMGEILLAISALSFAYSQAPNSMKSIVQASWLLTIFFGNLVDVIILVSDAFKRNWIEMFFFAGVVFVVTAVFVAIAMRYRYVENREPNLEPNFDQSEADEVRNDNDDDPLVDVQ